MLSQAMLVQPGVEMRRLRRASKKLMARHDCLRSRFIETNHQFRVVIAPPSGDYVREIDIGDVEDAAFHQHLSEIAHAPMQLMGNQLAELVVIHCGARGDVVMWRMHHAVTDGYGLLLLTEEFLKLLIGLPLTLPAVSYADYVARFMTVSSKRAAEISAFWEEMHRNLPKAQQIGRKAKGMQPLWRNMGDVVGGRKRFLITAESASVLEETRKREGLGAASILFTGFLETLCQNYNVENLAYTTLIARSDPGLLGFAGTHYFDPILPYHSMNKQGLIENAHTLYSNILQANLHLPSDAASQSSPHEDAMIEAGIYPRQFSVHEPRPTGRIKRSAFGALFRMEPGQTMDIGPYQVSQIDVSVYERARTDLRFAICETAGTIGFDLEYDAISYTTEEIDAIGARVCDLVGVDPQT